jgi:hypothetical protein
MEDLTSYYQDPNLQKAAGEAETAGTQAAAYQSASALSIFSVRQTRLPESSYTAHILSAICLILAIQKYLLI